MTKPTILTVDDDPQVSAAITRDLKRQYGAAYRVLPATSGAEALTLPRPPAPAAHAVRRNRGRDQRDDRDRPRLLPAQAVGPPSERLSRVIDDPVGDCRQAHREVAVDLQAIGDRWSEHAHERHHGTIAIDSSSAGTTLRVTLPTALGDDSEA